MYRVLALNNYALVFIVPSLIHNLLFCLCFFLFQCPNFLKNNITKEISLIMLFKKYMKFPFYLEDNKTVSKTHQNLQFWVLHFPSSFTMFFSSFFTCTPASIDPLLSPIDNILQCPCAFLSHFLCPECPSTLSLPSSKPSQI